MISILESKQSGTLDTDKGFDMYGKEIAAYTGSYRLVFLTWKRIYEIIKSRSKFHLKQGHFLSKHWGGAQFEGILPQYVRDKDGNFVGEKINNDF